MPLKDIRSTFLPYCVEQQSDGRYAVLNREYKPVGFWTRDFITYADHPTLVKIKGLTPQRAAKISHDGSPNPALIFLYNDGCVPTESAANMDAYLRRLSVLVQLKIDGEAPHTITKGE